MHAVALTPAAEVDQDEVCAESRPNVAVYLLFLVFGTGAWLTLNGSFSVLPLLVEHLPEGWRMASALAVAVQLANAGPALYMGVRWLALRFGRGHLEEHVAVVATYIVLATGVISMFGLAAAWDTTMMFAGSEHSVAFVVLVFLAAFADCTSSVLFWRFAGEFPEVYMSAMGTGQGMSGVATSLITWVQCVGCAEPNFSASVYFVILAALVGLSAVAYTMLLLRRPSHHGANGASTAAELQDDARSYRLGDSSSDVKGTTTAGLLGLQMWVNFLVNGTTLSCLPLAAKPYGVWVYQMAQNFTMLIDPVAAGLGLHIPLAATALIPVAVTMTALHGYIFVLSLDATAPPLLFGGGGWMLIVVAALARALSAYTKVRINILFKVSDAGGSRLLNTAAHRASTAVKQRLMWSGVAMQCGSFVGSVSVFALINLTDLFRSAS